MERWNGKVAVVTGASSGIGKAIAEKLVEKGMIPVLGMVAGVDRRKDKLDEFVKKLDEKAGSLHVVVADMTKESDILKAFEYITTKLGSINVLVNSAGIAEHTTLTDGKTDAWRNMLETNVLGLCIATREAVRNMKANCIDGHIIHMNSIAGHGEGGSDIYGASKFAVTSLTESLRKELNTTKSKIKITSISPGFVETSFIHTMSKSSNGSFPKEAAEYFVLNNPALQSEDIADSVLYVLATPPHVQVHEIIIRPVGEAI